MRKADRSAKNCCQVLAIKDRFIAGHIGTCWGKAQAFLRARSFHS
jgi:hypothetical protein